MEQRAKVTVAIIMLVIVGVAVYRFKSYMLDRNYLITAQSACDPALQRCFKSDCDASDPSCDSSPYKKVSMRASEAPACLLEHTCDANLECSTSNAADCSITYCASDTLESGEVCADAAAAQ